jgi:DNA-binding transcriptional LysR family regulator
VRLFDRVGRRVALNEIGRAFQADARAILDQVAAAEVTLADLSLLRRGRLTIHASQTIASYWLPRRLADFHLAYPDVDLDVRVGNTREAADAVVNGAADLGEVEGELDDPWARQDGVSAAQLAAQAWVVREPGSGTRSSLEAGLRAVGVDPAALNVALTLPSNEAVLAAAEAGAGAAALSESVAGPALQRGAVVKVKFPLPSRAYRLLRHKARYRTRASEAFVALTRTLRSQEPDDSYQI